MSDTLVVSTRKGLFVVRRRAAGAWAIDRVAFFGDAVSLALSDPREGALYAGLGLGHFGVKLHRSRDLGETWEELAAPAFPPMPEGMAEEKLPDGKPWPWRVEQIWSLEPGLATEPGRLWCGTIGGGLFRSDDAGASWRLVRGLWDHPKRKEWFGGGAEMPGIHSICVDPRDGARVTVGVSSGGVWATEDAGETWETRAKGMYAAYMPPERRDDPYIQDPHRVAMCAAHPEHLWSQHHNGVFRSTDGGRSWRDVPNVAPSVFGFGVVVHPRDPRTAWTVPGTKDVQRVPVAGQVVVSRTRDDGASWEVLREGLPQSHAYDIALRHALDIDATGDRLAFGSTTGSLWVSEDQGDRWHHVSAHLPPIYAVQFLRSA